MPKKYSEKQLSERQKVLLIHFSGVALAFFCSPAHLDHPILYSAPNANEADSCRQLLNARGEANI